MCKHDAVQVLQLDDKIKELAKSYATAENLLIMGRGFNFANCLEGVSALWL